MKATANAPVAVASSSRASNTNIVNNNSNNKNFHPNQSLANSNNKRVQPPLWLVNSMADPGNISTLPSNRPSTSASDPSNLSGPQPIRPIKATSEPSSARAQQSTVPTNPPCNSDRIVHHIGADPNNPRLFSPRRRRNREREHTEQLTPQSPKNTRNHHNGQNPDPSKEPPQPNRLLVTGYPTYTQPHDLLEVFTKFGSVRIDNCNSFSATLTYATAEQAKKALGCNRRVHIYGHFLSVRPYSAKLRAEQGPQSPKREFTMTKQKSLIIKPSKIDLSGDFDSQLEQITAAIRLNQEDISKISTLYTDIEGAFQEQWPGCKAIPFGSITTGLGIKSSDADCFVTLPPHFRQPHANHVNRARRLLMQYPQTFTEILAIPRANTPIVKFYHVPTDTNCDLTFKTPLGAQNSRLIAFLLNADPRITPVAVVIKYWAKIHELSGTGKLTNYALTMLIIFYFQQPPFCLLPSVEWLQRDRTNDFHVDFWNTGFMSDPNFLPPTSSAFTVLELLGGFFSYYAMFNFDEMVVCPFLGTPIKKEAFMNTRSLPNEFDLYKNNVINNFVMPIRYQTSFCVQDPFEQCHNVASTITSKLASDIRAFFKFAAEAYEKEKLECGVFLRTIMLDKPKLIRGKSHPEYRVNLFPRIINTIISFEWKSIVRQLVKTIFEKMLKIKLGKVEEKVNPDSKKEKEKYMGSVTKPIWRRKKYNFLFVGKDLSIEEKQALLTEELLKNEMQPISLQFQLCMTFCHDPKSAVISIRMGGGDLDAFREFGMFFMSVMQSWFTQLLKPFSMPNCKDTAAKIAETVDEENSVNDDQDSDDDEEIVITPRTRPEHGKDETEENTEENAESCGTPPLANDVAEVPVTSE